MYVCMYVCMFVCRYVYVCMYVLVMMVACQLKWKYLLFSAAEIKMPSGNVDKPIIEDNRDGTVSVKYEPREEGLHELSVKYNGEHVQGELTVFKLVGNVSVMSHCFF